jgi:phage terminase large subunit GpA-like protein
VWEELVGATIDNTWRFAEGGDIRIGRMFVDTGFHWEETLRFCKEHWSGGRMLPCRGVGADKRKTVGGGPIIHSEHRTKHPPYATVVNVDVNVAKDQIAAMLAKTEPGAGFVHIPSGPGGAPIRGFDPHVIEEYTAESCTVKMVNGFKQYTWHKVAHRSNERLDCLVYSLAALIHSRVNLDKLSGPLVVPEAKEAPRPQQTAKHPTWGVIHRAPLPNDTDGWEQNARAFYANNLLRQGQTTRPEDKPRSPWRAINRPIEW